MSASIVVNANWTQMVVSDGERTLIVSIMGKMFPLISVDRPDRSNLYIGKRVEKAKQIVMDYFIGGSYV